MASIFEQHLAIEMDEPGASCAHDVAGIRSSAQRCASIAASEARHLARHFIGLISAYGPVFVGGMLALECLCIPVPGETVLLTAAIYAGKTNDINIWTVFVAGVAGAACGNLLAFWLGGKYGHQLLWRYGSYVHLTPARLRLGQYLFLLHGGKFVILARFVPLLRSIAGVLAGANCMPGSRFLVANLAGALTWVGLDCTCAYSLGRALARLAPWVSVVVGCIVILVIAGVAIFLKRHEKRLELEAERALGGGLGKHSLN